MENHSNMGRPKVDDYRKKILRFSAVENKFTEILKEIDSENERKTAEKLFKALKQKLV